MIILSIIFLPENIIQNLMHYLISEISFYEILQHCVANFLINEKMCTLLFYLCLKTNFQCIKTKIWLQV